MAKHAARCPKCGARIEVDTAAGEQVQCSACGATLRLPGKKHPSQPADPLLGTTLGDFETLELLGRGGMGAVYKARQRSLDRLVALKVLPQSFSRDASFVERFAREARAAAAVSHPNIIEVFAVGSEGGHQFIAMEFIDGETLGDVLKREGRLAPERALALMKQVAAALATAHECGILHRDIKPSNILLTARGHVKLADFGLAKRPDTDVSVTVTGQSLGTPLYMPPEVARGRPAEARSDLYSLGATFYHALAARPPFQGASAAELIVKHTESRAPPLAQLAPDAPPALCRIVHRLLRKRPADRYASAEKLLEALARVEAAPPQPAAVQAEATRTLPGTAHPSRAERLEARKRQRRRAALVGAATGGVALVLLIVLLAVLGGGDDRQAKAPPDEEAERKEATRKEKQQEPETPKADPHERRAEALFEDAQRAVESQDWAAAADCLDRLEDEFADTAFYADHRYALVALRRKTDQATAGDTPPPDDERWTEWEDLFDGKTLDGWEAPDSFESLPKSWGSGKAGTVSVEDGQIVLGAGHAITAIGWQGPWPRKDYEVFFEVMRRQGADLCSVFVPIGAERAVVNLGGKRGTIAGLGHINGHSLTNNETTRPFKVEGGRWYAVRVRVADGCATVYVDGSKVIDVGTGGRRRFSVDSLLKPVAKRINSFGLFTFSTEAAFRSIRLRRLKPEPPPDDDERWTEWEDLFDGKSLDGWRIAKTAGSYDDPGEVRLEDDSIVLGIGNPCTGIAWSGEFPKTNYEVSYEAKVVSPGADFASAYFPVGESACVLVIASRYTGLDMVDGLRLREGGTEREWEAALEWHTVRLRVTPARIEAWVDQAKVVDLATAGHRFSTAGHDDALRPFGLVTYKAAGAVRRIRLRRLEAQGAALPPPDAEGWHRLFDGQSLEGWRVLERFPVAREFGTGKGGRVAVEDQRLLFEPGDPLTGIAWTGELPREGYELELQAARLGGPGDGFLSLTFPVGDARSLLAVGAEGQRVELKKVEGAQPGDDRLESPMELVDGRRYRVALRVGEDRVEAWLDGEKKIDVGRRDRTFEAPNWSDPAAPFSVHAWQTRTAIESIRLRHLQAPPGEGPDGAAAEQALQSALDRKVMPALRERRYADAQAALDQIAGRDDLRGAEALLGRARRRLARLQGLWGRIEKQAAALRPGQQLRVRGMRVTFEKLEDGVVHFKMGQARSRARLAEMKATDLLELLGEEALAEAATRLAAAAFLTFDHAGDPERAMALLDDLPDEGDAAALRKEAKEALGDQPPPPDDAHDDEEQRTSRAAVAAALNWLARAQEDDGRWRGAPLGGASQSNWDLGVTGLALRAFLAAGHTHRKGDHRKSVGRALAWLVKRQERSGSLGWETFYEQGIATLALCEAYGLSRDPQVGRAAQRAVAYICTTQPDHGGFRYEGAVEKAQGDLSVTSWQITAMRAAADAGLRLSKDAVPRSRAFLRSVHRPGRGSCYVVSGEEPTASMTAAGLTCRILMKWPDRKELEADADIVLGHVRAGGSEGRRLVHDLYYTYYAVRAMHAMGEPYWSETDRRVRRPLLDAQERRATDADGRAVRGSWDPANHQWGSRGGRVYTTAMAVLCLTAPAGRR